jgi:LacI family transcriptional regulator
MVEGSERKRFQNLGVTLADVARAAGVSPATVSRVLNHPDAVRERLRESVRDAVSRLGYLPHGAARALASRRSNTIGAIVPTLDNAIFARCIDALQRRLDAGGYVLLLATTEYDRVREIAEAEALLERGVDGLMLVGAAHDPALWTRLARHAIPVVTTWNYDPAGVRPCVGFDNARAAMRVTHHLLDLGHRRVAMIAGLTSDNDRAAARVYGVRRALAERGILLRPELLIERPYSIPDGRQAMRMLAALADPPTAVICGNDVLAIGALLECIAAGIAVPGRISITGFDDLELASHLQPPLTTIRVPSAEMGRLAASYLIDRLAGRITPALVELEAELILRGTTAPPS